MHNFRILLVEDDFTSSMDCCEFLRSSGMAVTEADCAAAAFAVLGEAGHISALVTDIDLGAGADGFEVARRARAAYPDIPVVYISGAVIDRHAAEGVDGSTFVPKPLHPRQILEALGRAKEAAGGARGLIMLASAGGPDPDQARKAVRASRN
jgi:CheY-like chemotaxis protein